MDPMTGFVAGAGLNLAGGLIGAGAAAEANKKNIKMQKEFAKNGVRWKVEDAKAAGIHPLYALGANTVSFSPSTVGDNSIGNAMSNIGQDLTRAAMSSATSQEKELAGLQIASAKLDLEGKAIDNSIRAAQLKKISVASPPFPSNDNFIPGQGNSGTSGRITNKPLERTMTLPGSPHSEPGAIPEVGWSVSPSGGLIPVPSQDVKNRIEDVMPHEWSHYFRNNILPNFGAGPRPPKSALPPGATDWMWSHARQEFQPYYGNSHPAARSAYDKYFKKGGR